MKITIKNMICPANMLFVRMEMEKFGIPYKALKMGSAELYYAPSEDIRKEFSKALSAYGLEVIYNDKGLIIQDIKSALKLYKEIPSVEVKNNLTSYLTEKLNYSFSYLNKIFLNETGISIEKYFRSQKIERAIILLMHYNLSPYEISIQLNYDSEEELRNDFKNITGMMPESYKQLRTKQTSLLKKKNQWVEY
jgi:AraC-like DNA-binding protein